MATKCGYLLTVTGVGKTIKSCWENLIEYIKNNLYISGQKYRMDIGKRIEPYESELTINNNEEKESSTLIPKKKTLFIKV